MDRTESRPRLSDIAQDEILYRIRSGGLAEGTRLPSEPELARQMGISRGILREALNALQARGFITRTPRGGSHITRRDPSALIDGMTQGLMNASLSDLIDYREALETFAARAVLRKASDEDLARLRALSVFTPDQHLACSRDFHYRLAELSGVKVFAQYIDFYFERVEVLASPDTLSEPPRGIDRDLERIMAALEARSLRQINTALRRLFLHIRKYYRRVLPYFS